MPVNSFDDYPMSWRPVLTKSTGSINDELISKLKEDIDNGNLLPGTKLPPQRELADYLDINVSTVSRAFKKCEEEGILTGAVGSGTFVAYKAISSEALAPHSGSSGVVEMGSLSPTILSNDIMNEVLGEIIADNKDGHIFEYYYQSKGLWHKEAAVKLISRTDFKPETESIFFSHGGQNGLAAILMALFKPGDRLGTDELVFPGLKALAAMLGIRLVPIRSRNGEMSKEGLIHSIKNEKLKGIYITPDYQNPTTHVMSHECKEMIAGVAKKYNIPVIEDAIFALLSERKLSTVAALAPENTIHISSISKVVAPGLRVAYISAPEKYRNAIGNSLSAMNLSISPLTLELSSRIIVGEHFEKLVKAYRNETESRNKIIEKGLKEYDLRGGKTSPFKWLVLPDGMDAMKLEEELHSEKVQVNAVQRFAVGNAVPYNAVRLNGVSPRRVEDLKKAVNTIKIVMHTI